MVAKQGGELELTWNPHQDCEQEASGNVTIVNQRITTMAALVVRWAEGGFVAAVVGAHKHHHSKGRQQEAQQKEHPCILPALHVPHGVGRWLLNRPLLVWWVAVRPWPKVISQQQRRVRVRASARHR
jgi:hypothetical protein